MPPFIKGGFRNIQKINTYSSSNEVKISYVMDNSWLIQESPGLNPDWFLFYFLVKDETVY